MCGIAGIYALDGRPINAAQLMRMGDLLKHRGPDDEGYALFDTRAGPAGYYKGPDTPADVLLPDIRESGALQADLGLVERRLAILDLSPAGHTPMSAPEGDLTVVFNGEIYNYIELRAELSARGHTFRSAGDTEVLLAAYREWGEDCVRRFNGMWAFAIWDARRRLLFCSRDRFGKKPFYYLKTASLFAFASEPKALWASGLAQAAPNSVVLEDFLAGYEASDPQASMFQDISQLPAAHSLTVEATRFALRRYWSLPVNPELGPAQPDESVSRQVFALLREAVRLRLRADVPIGTCLSGGLDSSSIVAIVNDLMQVEHNIPREQIGERQKTFTASYDDPGSDERRFAQQVVAQTNAAWHQTFPTADGLWADMQRFIWHHDEPPITTSMYAQWRVMKLASQHAVKVVLDGQGADELLAGYLPFEIYLAQILRAGQLIRVWQETRAMSRVGSRSLSDVLRRLIINQLPQAVQRRVRLARRAGLRPDVAQQAVARHQQIFDAHSQSNLPTYLARLTEINLPRLLRAEDRNSMAFSIEARAPFLDVNLSESISQLPAGYRIHNGWSKYVLRRAVQHILPDSVVWRRDKKGFVTPEMSWMRELRPMLLDLFQDKPRTAPWIQIKEALTILKDEAGISTPSVASALWRWSAAELWLRMIEQPAKA